MKSRTLKLGLFLIIITIGCRPNNDERKLNDLTVELDKLLRSKSVDYQKTLSLLENIDSELSKSVTIDSKKEHWHTFLTTKWNTDSTFVLIRSNKKFEKGFKREIILNYNDTLLFTYTFMTHPFAFENDYSFIESFSYSKPGQPIRYISRADYDHDTLLDTLEFRKKSFNDFGDSLQRDVFSFEMEYAKNALEMN